MIGRSRAWIAFTLLFAGCGPARDTSVTAELAPSLGLTEMVLLWRTAGFDRGDTVYVNLSEFSDDGTVPYYENGDPAGTLRLETLGRTDEGIMIVNASRLMVRRCRSTGCSEVGYVVHGQALEVREPAGGWYRMLSGGEPLGYIYGQYLRHPLAYHRNELAVLGERTAEYYERELAGLTLSDGRPAFSGHDVLMRDELLSFEFYTPHREAHPEICNAMRGIALFVQRLMAAEPREVFPAFFAGVYYGTNDDVMLAGMADEDNIFCETPPRRPGPPRPR
ncbi:MAG: SH3 domain-containing protein [Gemmatimonadales bacterium]|jgi:hypothetical protein